MLPSTLMRISGLALLSLVAAAATSRAEFDPAYFSVGFETEFAEGGRDRLKSASFSFLEEQWTQEETGNLEVRSLPVDRDPAPLFHQAHDVAEVLGKDLKSFHFHVRFPKYFVPDEAGFKTWVRALGDLTFAWRLQNRNSYYALSTSNSRPSDLLLNRSTIRLMDLNTHWDLEFRGYMGDLSEYEKMVRTLVTALKRPDRMRILGQGFSAVQKATPDWSPRMKDKLNSIYGSLNEPRLGLIEEARLELMTRGIPSAHLLPQLDFAKMDLSAEERIALETADREFALDLRRIFASPSNPENQDAFREAIKTWAIRFDLYGLFRRRITIESETPVACARLIQ